LAIFGLFLLSACGRGEQQTFALADAEDYGIIISYEAVVEWELQVAEAIRQDITGEENFVAQLVFPITEHLHLQNTRGELTLLAEEGQRVMEGDVLARLVFDADARAEMNYLTARRNLEQIEENFTQEHNERLSQISDARARIAGLEGNARRRALLELELLEVGLERFLLVGRTNRDTARDEVAAIEHALTTEEIIAPFDGMISFVTSHPNNLDRNPRIISIVNDDVFFFRLSHSHNFNIMGRGDIVTLSVDGFEFDTQVVTDSWAGGERSSFTYWLAPMSSNDIYEAALSAGAENPMLTLLNARTTARVDTIRAVDTIVLPRRAFRNDGRGDFVYVYNDGRTSKRYINAGLRTTNYGQVISGLEPGTQVVISP